jgi:hypothetical protein
MCLLSGVGSLYCSLMGSLKVLVASKRCDEELIFWSACQVHGGKAQLAKRPRFVSTSLNFSEFSRSPPRLNTIPYRWGVVFTYYIKYIIILSWSSLVGYSLLGVKYGFWEWAEGGKASEPTRKWATIDSQTGPPFLCRLSCKQPLTHLNLLLGIFTNKQQIRK